MKKYFYGLMIFLFMGIMMQSCKEETNSPSLETKNTQQETDMASWNQVQQQLNALDMSYGLTKNIRRSPSVPGSLGQVTEYTNWDFNNMGFNWGVPKADAEGFCSGAGAAGGICSGIGFLSGGPAGAAWGAIVGGVIGGIVVGAIYSVDAFQKENGTQAVINSYNPFIYVYQGNRFADGNYAPIGSEIGDLHNSMVNEMLQDANFMELTTLADMYDYVCTTNLTFLSGYFTYEQIVDIQAYLADNRTVILDTTNWSTQTVLQSHTDELNIIKHYAYVVSQTTTPFDIEQYTSDFMQLIDDAYTSDQIHEESALMINGTISTLYCSKTAWNYIQPDPYQTTQYIVNSDTAWYVVNSLNALTNVLGSDPSVNFVGYPYIDNDTLKRIYVHANNTYNMDYANDSVMHILFDGLTYENTVSRISVYNMNLYNTAIPTGYYSIYPAQGYDDYIYIEFEQ